MATTFPNRRHEYLTFRQAVEEFPGLLHPVTMRSWVRRGYQDFDKLITRAGRSLRIRRDRLERFLGEDRA